MKTNPAAPKDIDEYIAGFPMDVRPILEKVRATIQKAAPEAEEALKYQIPTFTLNGNLVPLRRSKTTSDFIQRPEELRNSKMRSRNTKVERVL